MDFKEWMYFYEFENHHILNESFRLPFTAYKRIYDFLMRSYNQWEKTKTIPQKKTIPIDLSGTNYDFLSYLKPKLEVEPIVNPTDKDVYASYKGIIGPEKPYYGINFSEKNGVTGAVEIAMGTNDEWISTISHEVLHFIQDLIEMHLKKNNYKKMRLQGLIHKQGIKSAKDYEDFRKQHNNNFNGMELPAAPWRYWNKNAKDYFKDLYFFSGPDPREDVPEYLKGGLPSPKIVKKIMKRKKIDLWGNKIPEYESEDDAYDNIFKKPKLQKISYSKIPVEYYTILNSAVERLKQEYARSLAKDNLDKEEMMEKAQDHVAKRAFFRSQIEDINPRTGKYYNQLLKDVLFDIKKLSKKIYRKYIQTIEKEFIYNNDIYPDLVLHSKANKALSQRSEIVDDIEVIGNKRFMEKTKKAILILRKSKSFEKIKGSIGIIEQADKSGMTYWASPPRFQVAEETYNLDPIWYASTIANGTYRSKLYKSGEKPIGKEAEIECLKFQRKVLQEINAPEYQIEHIDKLLKNMKY